MVVMQAVVRGFPWWLAVGPVLLMLLAVASFRWRGKSLGKQDVAGGVVLGLLMFYGAWYVMRLLP